MPDFGFAKAGLLSGVGAALTGIGKTIEQRREAALAAAAELAKEQRTNMAKLEGVRIAGENDLATAEAQNRYKLGEIEATTEGQVRLAGLKGEIDLKVEGVKGRNSQKDIELKGRIDQRLETIKQEARDNGFTNITQVQDKDTGEWITIARNATGKQITTPTGITSQLQRAETKSDGTNSSSTYEPPKKLPKPASNPRFDAIRGAANNVYKGLSDQERFDKSIDMAIAEGVPLPPVAEQRAKATGRIR